MISMMTSRFKALIALAAAVTLTVSAHAETVEGRRIYVIDGDTVAVHGQAQRIRLLDIDAPETSKPRCERELALALRAKERLVQLIRDHDVSIERKGTDRYRRSLARLRVNGRDVGQILLAEGHAVRWRPGRKAWEERAQHWCGGGYGAHRK